ncbi:glycosyltransferase [Amycolatopsis sp. YIM 10]|uniref:glycosyltransferase family protein n=1 Tax=Amycolatopsis sp. YIM 10 TaxID=2653857 RepID=UPI0012903506|nr:glycosyltransferase [Amycolatopsis sp. YIM 10]QFU94104.1 Putative teichuronic acid biosynthesis glycosyltransferase TuaH [Amycolatopsis sp. YIM 10]
MTGRHRRSGRAGRRLTVVVSGVPWDGVKGSERQLAEALTAHTDVLFVDPPVSPATPARYRGLSGAGRQWRPRSQPVSDRLTRLTPVALPGLSRPGVRAATWPMVRSQIRRTLREMRQWPTTVIACSTHDVLGRWGAGVTNVLYGTDDWVAGAELMRIDVKQIVAGEQRNLAGADVVLAVGPELAARWRESGAAPEVFPNGCDPDAYAGIGEVTPIELPPGFPDKIAGLSGQLSDRIDLRLLEAVADTGVGLLLVGPRDPGWQPQRVDALLARDNVHHTGPVPFERLLPCLARFGVGLTPYADTAFNRASFPLKTLEYLAAGLPVVSTDLPASRRLQAEFRELEITGDADSYALGVLDALATPPTEARVAARRAFARRHSWAARAARLVELLENREGTT